MPAMALCLKKITQNNELHKSCNDGSTFTIHYIYSIGYILLSSNNKITKESR